jgi:signal transduction histidine kinase
MQALIEISHDLRNSLGVIANAVHWVGLVTAGDERIQQRLGLIRREVAEATRITGGLLEIARPPRADCSGAIGDGRGVDPLGQPACEP